jgi:general secretion pathway protein G
MSKVQIPLLKNLLSQPFFAVRKNLSQSGMSLMEIMIVLGIIATLLVVLIPQITDRQAKAKFNETKTTMGLIVQSINDYMNDCGNPPKSIEGLKTKDECENWGPEAYMKKIPKDGWKKDFIYESGEGNSYVLKSLGADGKEGGDGYNKDLSSEDIY